MRALERDRGEATSEDAGPIVLRLYVAGDSERSVRAVRHLHALRTAIGPVVRCEVVDVMEDPRAADVAGVMMAPTLILMRPEPHRRVIGDLSNAVRVLEALGVPIVPPDPADPGSAPL